MEHTWSVSVLLCSLVSGRTQAALALALFSLATSAQAQAQSGPDWNITKPLQICTASIQNFGARCNGNAGVPAFEKELAPIGPVPPSGWCASGEDFCGYDIDVWSRIAAILGLVEGRDFERVCLGESGFGYMIQNLARQNTTLLPQCDMGVSSITASVEREEMGIQFSRTTHRSALAVLVYAPLKHRGMWAFFEPLHAYVWTALVLTIIVTPFFVFFFESVFSKRSAYTGDGGRLHILHGITESLWHSISHTLSIDVFKVHAFPSRLITAAYAFLVLILTNTYTANLAAFLTVDQLDTQISDIVDLRGKAVVTIPPYVDRLYRNHRIVATDKEGWDYEIMVERLKSKVYTAVISDDTQLITRAYSDASCSLHILSESVEPFDLALAFAKDFAHPVLQEEISGAILQLQEAGALEEIKSEHQPPAPTCLASTEFSETNQVPIESLWGLWIILSVAIGLAGIAGLIDYELKRRRKSDKVVEIEERAEVFKRALTKSMSFAPRSASLSLRSSRYLDASDTTRSSATLRDMTLMSSGHDGIVPVACLEVVTESHEEASPKSAMLKQGGERGSCDSVKRDVDAWDMDPCRGRGAAQGGSRRESAGTAAAAAAAIAAIAEEEKAAAAAAAGAAARAPSGNQEELSASRAVGSARGTGSHYSASGHVPSASATVGLQRTSSRSATTATASEFPCFIPPDIPSGDGGAGDPPGLRLNNMLPLHPTRNLLTQHASMAQYQRSFGRSISTMSGRSMTPGHDGDTGSSLSHSHPQGDESEGGFPWINQPAPISLAVSAAPSGTESGGGFTRGSASDCNRSEGHNAFAAPSPPNAPQSPVEGPEGSGMDGAPGGVMQMAIQRLPEHLQGLLRGSGEPGARGGAPQREVDRGVLDVEGEDGTCTPDMDLHLASLRSDTSQLLGMPPSHAFGWVNPDTAAAGAAPKSTPGRGGVQSPAYLRSHCIQPSANGAGASNDASMHGAHACDDAACRRSFEVAGGADGAVSGAEGRADPVATGGHMHGSSKSADTDWARMADVDTELAQLNELVMSVAARVNGLMQQRRALRRG